MRAPIGRDREAATRDGTEAVAAHVEITRDGQHARHLRVDHAAVGRGVAGNAVLEEPAVARVLKPEVSCLPRAGQ